jgi:MFS transporter, AAHS family, 4-hydroxybenzoate transporter
MAIASEVQVSDFIDRRPFGRFQIGVVFWCFLVVFFDGFDTQTIGVVAPLLAKSLGIERSALGFVFTSGLVGLMVGCIVCGLLADRCGRKYIIIGCAALFGLSSLATVLATSITQLFVLRFLTGVGLGGALPLAVALVSEYAPRRRHATIVTIMACSFSVGAGIGGLIASRLLPIHGWQSMFYVGGIAPLVLIPFLVWYLPESIKLLVLVKQATTKIAAIIARIAPDVTFAVDTTFVIREEKLSGFGARHLFTEGRAAMTIFLWAAFVFNYTDLYFLQSWLVTIVHNAGLSVEQSALSLAMFQVGATIGAVVLGRLCDSFGFCRVLGLAFIGASISLALLGFAGTSVISLTVFAVGFFVVGGQFGAIALAGAVYPTLIRSTGVGWALAIGRIGSIGGPLVGGLLLSLDWPMRDMFLIAAFPAIGAALAIYFMSRTRSYQVTRPDAGLLATLT